MEFLEKVEQYHRLLDQITQLISSIHSTYLTPDGISELNLPSAVSRSVSVGVKNAAQKQLPALESIFLGAQDHVEKLLAGDAYHRFVKHQITTSATVALADNKDRFKGLGDCFCLTDPSIADNPILFASDGFVAVTGYSRKDIIPRNCRFLQGPATERASPIRLRTAIRNEEETVELLLNYRKNGDPFWNLLYVAPLYDEHGAIKFFIGGQVDVSTTVHNCTEVLKVLGQNVDDGDERASLKSANGRGNSSADGSHTSGSRRSSFFKSFRSPSTSPRIGVNKDAGMEGELINRVGKMNIRTQIEAFYTAYSKYIVMTYTASSSGAGMSISHYSPGVIDMLCLNLPNGAVAPIFHKDIFKVLAEHSASSSITKGFKQIVRAKLHIGNPVSVELGLLTGYEEVKRGGTFSRGHGDIVFRRTEQKYVSHWTPLKDEGGAVKWVVLTIAPK
ncbi:blue light receptor [Phlyctema vagabunda]|uniref:Blue light receptor n=1 Tax=Phlyctema vagabunda TaxID=108571 RepID=A0ABR4PVU3_9HELO